ncbi:MAG: glycosyltransferase family 4 protein [Anaerolineales bacterium]|nr:glycosyltransferase family 4 protein [Anaerolineales bacterium]
MRIAYIATSPIPSRRANALQVMKMCDNLTSLGHDVRLWTPGHNPGVSPVDLMRQFGLQHAFPIEWIRSATPLRHYDFCGRAVLAARRWHADLLYVRPLQAAALAAQAGLATLLDLHDRPHGRLGPSLLRAFVHGGGARRLVMTTHALQRWLVENYRLALEPPFAVVAPNAADLARYAGLPSPSEARRRLGWPDRLTASYTGQLYRGRGLDMLVQLARRHPTIQFVWAGGDPASVEGWRAELGHLDADNTRLLGFVPNQDLPMVHAASDILLMPYERNVYLRQGNLSTFYSPMKLFEYLAAGRVILSSDLPTLREVLNAENSILLPAEDLEAWDRALTALATEPLKYAPLAERAQRDSLQYGWSARCRKVLEGIGQ